MQVQSSDDDLLISQINVTPFVDVVLVLLVIFMVTAPIIAKDILKLNLPKTAAVDSKSMSQLAVAVNKQGQILLNGTLTTEENLREQVIVNLKAQPDIQAIISADQGTEYGNVVRVIDIIKTAGLNKFAIQVEKK
jgi:biopolymer transport protein TolR